MRFYILELLERLVCSVPNVRLMTVSEGLKKIILKKIPGKAIHVVYSIPDPGELTPFTHQDSHDKTDLVFFGLGDRAPIKMLEYLKGNKIKLDIYGRDMPLAITEYANTNSQPIRFLGEYNPSDMSFLRKYKYLILVSDKTQDNFRFSLPNKLFQALSYGLTPILSPVFEEAINLFKDVPGAVIVLHNANDLAEIIRKHKTEHLHEDRYNKVIARIQLLYNESKRIYQLNTTLTIESFHVNVS